MLHTHITTPTPLTFPAVATAHCLPQRLRPLPPFRRCSLLTSQIITASASKGMNWYHEMELQVRDYELDRFGVVNNAIYSYYFQYGTHQMFNEMGFNDDILALTQASYKFINPLRKKEKFLLKVRIHDYSAVRLYFEGFIFKLSNYEPILESSATGVMLDKSLRPTRIPPSLISKFDQFSLKENKRDKLLIC